MWVSYKYTYISSLLTLAPIPPQQPSPLGHHRAPNWVPCTKQLLPASCLFYTQWYIHVNTTFSFVPPSPSLRLLWGLNGKESTCNAGDAGSIPRSEGSPGGGHSNPLQYSCLKDPMDRGVWWAAVHGVAKSQTRLNGLRTEFCYTYLVSTSSDPHNWGSGDIHTEVKDTVPVLRTLKIWL